MPSRAGSPNKLKQALLKRLEEKFPEYHPVLEMAKVANDPEADPQMRFNANKEVAQYVTPKLKAVEHRGQDGQTMVPAFVMKIDGKTTD